MRERIRAEWQRLVRAASRLNTQTVFVLLAAVVLVFIQFSLGDRDFFREELAHLLPAGWRGLAAWAWWFFIQGITGFVLPVAALVLMFDRRPSAVGLGAGDWRLALTLAALYIPIVIVGTWFLSASPEFQTQYPHYEPAAYDWTVFLIYEAFFLFYWIGWEYLWRGFLLFGTAPTFGIYAIVVQTVPFAVLHFDKPLPEAFLSIVGGLALGALVWRCRSFWIAIPIHFAQMLILDFWCSLRLRTGINEVGLDALLQLLGVR